MQEAERKKIRDIKAKVLAMLDERHAIDGDGRTEASPSKYWSDFCSYFDYMLGLSEEHFAKLRLHTYHLTGDYYQIYYFGDSEQFKREINLGALVAGVPDKYILNEPEGGIGHRDADGRFISSDIARFQRAVTSMYRHRLLAEVEAVAAKRRAFVLEIGAGYGGMAHHLSRIVGNTTYIMVDLPETLIYSASYLTLLNPDKKIYLYDREDAASLFQSGALEDYDFILLPNYRLDLLEDLRFDMVVNLASLQEMRTAQAIAYLDFIRRSCRGVFYSWNEDSQPRNAELSKLSDLLAERFELLEITEENLYIEPQKQPEKLVSKVLRRVLARAGLSEYNDPPRILPRYAAPGFREYICRPRPSEIKQEEPQTRLVESVS